MPRGEDDVTPRSGSPSTRTLLQAGGFALAAVATLAVFLTDNPQLLRVAVVAVAWAFVLATFAAGRRGTDQVAAAAREAELRRAYELELEREVSARREFELELENEFRRETEDSMRSELDALRGDIAALAGLRDEVARVSELRGDLAALTSLRDEVARVAALRDDVAALNSLRQELGQLAELRADMSRLRIELTEQLSSEMLVERIVMRTQASRLPADSGAARSLETDAWTDDVPPRELTGGWPAVRLDEPRETSQFEQARVERPFSRPPVPGHEPVGSWHTSSWDTPPTAELRSWDTPPTAAFARPEPPPASAPPPPAHSPPPPPPPAYSPPPLQTFSAPPPPAASARDEPRLWSSSDEDDGRTGYRYRADEPAPPTAAFSMSPPARATPTPVPEPLPSPLEWLAARSLVDPAPTAFRPEVPPRRRRSDDAEQADPAAAPTTQRPAVLSGPPPVGVGDRAAYRVPARPEPPDGSPGRAQDKRLDEILAENGVSPASGGRRRRRYRDEDESDDVLARVLGRN
jgi:hypothetical protein